MDAPHQLLGPKSTSTYPEPTVPEYEGLGDFDDITPVLGQSEIAGLGPGFDEIDFRAALDRAVNGLRKARRNAKRVGLDIFDLIRSQDDVRRCGTGD